MIDRYTRPEMGHIFSLENKYAIWQEIEVLACEAQAELGKIGISKDEAQWIRDHANFEKAKVDEIEEVTRHDVIAFLTNMKEYIDADVPEGDPKPSRWVHYGMTSSDLPDMNADKVVGKGAAALMVLGGVEGLFADVVSRPALELLAGAGIAVEYTVVVPNIVNRAGTGTCPVEQLCAGAASAAECLPLIEGFMQKMKERHG